MMRTSKEEIGARASKLAAKLRAVPGLEVEILDGESVIGGGAAPSATLPTRLIAVAVKGLRADEMQARFRASETPIIARVQDGRVLLDLRTVLPQQEAAVVEGCSKIAEK